MPVNWLAMSRRKFAATAAAMAAGGCAGRGRAQTAAPAAPAGVSNVRVTRDGFAAHIEPAAAADPARPGHLLMACRVFQDSKIGLAAYRSSDAGRSWQPAGLLPGITPDYDGNAAVAIEGHGRGYIGGIVATAALPHRGGAQVWRTDDGGATFGPPVTAIAAPGGLADHPGLAIDSWSGARPRPLYAVAGVYGGARTGLALSQSRDGGQTFSGPRFLPLAGGQTALAPVISAGPGGLVCVACLVPGGDGVTLQVVCSADHGQTFGRPVRLARLTSLAPSLGSVTMKGGPTISTGGGRTFIAVTSYDEDSGQSRILVFCSVDQGQTWTGFRSPAGSTAQIFLQPQLAVDATGRAGLSVCALSVATRQLNVLLYLARPRELRLREPLRVTSQSFDPARAIRTGSSRWLGNYQGMAAAADVFHPVWTDTRDGDTQIYTAAVRV